MSSPTPLQILLSLLKDIPVEQTPEDARVVRLHAQIRAGTPRAWEVVDYLIAAADGRLGPRGSGGSLKHVLWWLRDNAGALYVPAAREALQMALEGAWPLSNALPHLKHGRVVGQFVDLIGETTNSQALLAQAQEKWIGGWRVAVYTGTRNLVKPAMRAGFDVYVALSERGGVVKARRGLALDGSLFPGWKQVYPDLLILEGDWKGGIDGILHMLPEAVHGRRGNAGQP